MSSIEAYKTREVLFTFRGIEFSFALSQELFSSADIDAGTRLLLRSFSALIDADTAAGRAPPVRILDAGSGTGVIGICAARALAAANGRQDATGKTGPFVRAQDRDELARIFTEYNARKNGVPPENLKAYTEPLLFCPSRFRWDLILSNIPAKTGEKVLGDFIPRSASLLAEEGRVLMAAVAPLASFFRSRIRETALPLHEKTGKDYSVFLYGAGPAGKGTGGPAGLEDEFSAVYFRCRGGCEMEHIGCYIEAFHGAPGFDRPGRAVELAAKLAKRLGAVIPRGPALFHEPDQGHFPVWLTGFFKTRGMGMEHPLVLAGRNIIALEASRRNLERAAGIRAEHRLIVELPGSGEELLAPLTGRRYRLIASFAGFSGKTEISPYWEVLPQLLETGGVVLAALPASRAEALDRKKPSAFTRLGDLKRGGFRALAYRLDGPKRTPP